MAANSIGLFGSNVGAGSKGLKKPRVTPGGVPLKADTSTGPKAPTIHASPIHLTQAELGLTSSGSSISIPSGGTPVGQPTAGGGGAPGILGEAGGLVSGFLGHLGADVVRTTLGMPLGLVHLMTTNPVDSVETMAKMTWADWSPLFHGDVGLWAHNFYAHPLAPILDVASVVTLGAGASAKGASLAVMAGERGALADAAAVQAEHGVMTAAQHSAANEAVLAARTGKLARYANPVKAENYRISAEAGASWNGGAMDAEKYAKLYTEMTTDPGGVYRVSRDMTGSTSVKVDRYVNNPITRPIQKWMDKTTEKVAQKFDSESIFRRHVLGEQARYNRWSHLDKGQRSAAVQHVIHQQLAALTDSGKLSASMSVGAKLGLTIPVVARIMKDNARSLTIKPGQYTEEIQKALEAQGLAPLRDGQHVNLAEDTRVLNSKGVQIKKSRITQDKIVKQADAAVARGTKHDVALAAGLKKMGPLFTTKDPAQMAVDEAGNIKVVSNTLAHKMANEAHNGDRALRALYQEPTRVWRHLLLGLSPRYFVNNFIGNSIMLIAATDPVNLTKAFIHHVRLRNGAAGVAALRDESLAQAGVRANQLLAMTPTNAVWAAHRAKLAAQTGGADEAIAAAQTEDLLRGGNHGLFSGGKAAKSGAGVNPIDAHLSAEHRSTMSSQAQSDLIGSTRKGVSGWLSRKPNLYRITQEWADEPQRLMAMNYSVMRTPEYQVAVARHLANGKSAEEAAFQATSEVLKQGPVREMVASQVRHMLGQYHTFSKTEKFAKGYLIPFYAWDRAIVRHMQYIITESPYKAAMGAAIGAQGANQLKQMIGNAPDFMQSMIPLGFLGNSPGRVAAFNALTMSPYGSVGDLANLGMSLVGLSDKSSGQGSDAASNLNPILTSLTGQLSGTDPTTGAPVKTGPGGLIGGTAYGAFGHLPQINLLEAGAGNNAPNITSSGRPTLYEHNFSAVLSSFLGIPIRQISPPAANYTYNKEHGIKAPSKKKNMYSIPGF